MDPCISGQSSPPGTLISLRGSSPSCAAYEVEVSVIGDDRIPPLHEEVEELCAAPLSWLGAFDDDGRLIGMVAWVEDADGLDIDRLVVDPTNHCRGAGRLSLAP